MTVIMVNTCPNPSMKGGAPCTVKMIRRVAEGFRQLDDFQQLSPSANPLRANRPYRSEAIRRLVELGLKAKGRV